MLAGRSGPGNPSEVRPQCWAQASRRPAPHVDCCKDLGEACRVDVPGAGLLDRPAHFQAVAGGLRRDLPCAGPAPHHHECCAVRPSPSRERVDAGYPFTLDRSPTATAPMSVARTWTYGGTGYAVSAGLMDEIPRDAWHRCVDAVICGNADQRVHTCLFNLGFTYHNLGNLGEHRDLGKHHKDWRRGRVRTRWRALRKRARRLLFGAS